MLPQQMCLFSEAVSFILFLQGAHGLKGNEGPHGPPGPAVSTTYRIRILSLSLLALSLTPSVFCLRLWELSS